MPPKMPALEPTGPRSAAPGYAEPGVNVAVQAERTGVTPSVMIAEIMGRRARLVAGPATYSDSDMFKGPVGCDSFDSKFSCQEAPYNVSGP